MKRTNVTVPWEQGLHARPATRLVQLARRYRSAIHIKAQDRMADARSILSVLLLCATFGTMLEVEVFGEDEEIATSEIEQLFEDSETRETSASRKISLTDSHSNELDERDS